ncbi:mycothiol S-conjugate amidase [Mycetocola sp. BIGb0189]|uniref:mycothiol conjugate amidase Mca n=1 Tax=Mycetocola TaxID=76634 RepID=UPI00160274F6|nr:MULTISPECIES: mycothiol conjugate amidase Mca [Mycetocola]MCS4275446.1 mycothiol S-conjugate amidase [Mycetocola sp. BIGb0189]
MAPRLLAVHAHPDDESSKGSATLASYRHRGYEVMVVSCTGGERGDIQNPYIERKALGERDLPGLRRLEMAEAASILDIQHRWLGYYDSGMPSEDGTVPPGSFASIPLEISAEPLVRLIREYRPHVITTYDENGGYPHPDHIRTNQIAEYAFEAAADPTRYPEAGPAWQISKLYYDQIFNPARVRANLAELRAGSPDPDELAALEERMAWISDRPDRATTHVEVGDFFERRDAALRAHACQVPPDSGFFFWDNDLQRRAWPYEDFELARSVVPTTIPESDLFAGIEDLS